MPIRKMQPDDRLAVHSLLREVHVFEPHEIQVAEEVIEQHLAGGRDYLVHIAEAEAGPDGIATPLVGFICHGHNAVTDAVHDIYWIVVHPNARRRGIGRALLDHAEQSVRDIAGRAITIETSCLPEFGAARRLYEACGYKRVAEIGDFYKPGDAMRTYMKFL